jgi:hypothetical protein
MMLGREAGVVLDTIQIQTLSLLGFHVVVLSLRWVNLRMVSRAMWLKVLLLLSLTRIHG